MGGFHVRQQGAEKCKHESLAVVSQQAAGSRKSEDSTGNRFVDGVGGDRGLRGHEMVMSRSSHSTATLLCRATRVGNVCVANVDYACYNRK